MPLFNLAELLYNNMALEHLHLVVNSGNLRHELQSRLPPSLAKVTVEAVKLPVLHPAALKVGISGHLCNCFVAFEIRTRN